MTLESLARTIAKARHGTDAMWANYMGAAREAQREVVEACIAETTAENVRLGHTWLKRKLRALLAHPDGAQE